MSGGFVGSAETLYGDAWLVGYNGDVTFVPVSGAGTAYPIPTASSGDTFVGAAVCGGSPYFVSANGDIFTISGGAVTPVTPGFGQQVSSISSDRSRLYAILPLSSNLATYTFATLTTGSFVTATAPMSKPAFVAASSTGIAAVGGSSDSVIHIGAVAFRSSPYSTNEAAAVDTATNNVYLLTGTDPNWTVNNTVSGTGHPVDLAWVSAGEQVLVADTTSNQVEVFNLVAGVLVQAQYVSVTGVVALATTIDGMTAMAAQPSLNQVSVLSNTANLWAISSTVTVNGATAALGLSNTEFAIGGTDALTWLQSANNGWIVATSVSGLAFTPTSLATDANGTIFAAGTNAGTGYLAAINKSQVLSTANWSGKADAVLFEQSQIAVADSTNSLIRTFAFEGNSLVQKATATGPTGLRALGTTPPSVWVCGPSTLSQFAFTAPFELGPQPNGVFALYQNSTWVSGATGVLNRPTAAAWDASGTVWGTTEQDVLHRFSMQAVSVSGISLAPYRANSQVPIGISDMVWWQNGLFAVSSLNSSLMEVSGSASPGVPGIVPGPLLGVNFILGESFYQ
jgi:hypothetical protein